VSSPEGIDIISALRYDDGAAHAFVAAIRKRRPGERWQAIKRFALAVVLVTVLVPLAWSALDWPHAGAGPAATWTAPAPLNTNAGTDLRDDWDAQVATDSEGHWVAVWDSRDSLDETIGTDGDILVARSTDNGASWTAPVALNTNAATDAGYDWDPRVTTDGEGNWLVVWWSHDTLGGTIGPDDDILVSRSTDNGVIWTPPVALNTNAATDSGDDWRPQLTTDGEGIWVTVWNSDDDLGGTIGGDHDILVSRSTDNGVTWTPPAALNTNAPTDSGDDVRVQLTTDGGGNWLAVWRSDDSLSGTIGTDYDVLVSRSTDDGASWTPPVALNTNASTDSGSDYQPQVTTDRGGIWVAAWWSNEPLGGTIGTDYDILFSRSTDNGATWTPPAPLNTNADSDSGGDHYLQVTTDGSGNWLAAWDSWDTLGGTIGTDDDILFSRSTDGAASWTAPAALNTNAATDSAHDLRPQVTTDGGGNWLVVWWSEDTLGGTIGADDDIFYTTEHTNEAPTPTLAPPVGGIAALPDVSGSSAHNYAVPTVLAAVALVCLTAGAWYARRRWGR